MKHIERLHICTYTHTITHTHTYFFFFLIGATSQSSGKLVWSIQLPLLPACFGGLAWSERPPSECTAAHALPQGKGGTQKLCKPLPLDRGVGAGGSPPGTSQPQAMQGLGLWNGQARQAQLALFQSTALLSQWTPGTSFLTWGRGRVWVEPHSHPQPFAADGPETTLLPKVMSGLQI